MNNIAKNLFSKPLLALAPMAGYTDIGFRHLAKKYGADLVYTEMISAKAICYDSENTKKLMAFKKGDNPIAIQLFGHNPLDFKEAILKCNGLKQFDVIDINMGCPAPKIFKNGDGSALLANFDLAEQIIKTVVSVASQPVSVKFRSGLSKDDIVAVEFAKMCERAGASFITIHARTRAQGYSGVVDKDVVKKVVKAVNIPVIASGDCRSKKQFDEYINMGCKGVMIGRGAVGKPEIFKEIKLGKNIVLTNKQKLKQIKIHYNLLSSIYPDYYVNGEIKKHIAGYLKVMGASSETKSEVLKQQSFDDMLNILNTLV